MHSRDRVAWREQYNGGMSKNILVAAYVVLMVATIVIVDVLFFRYQFGKRLLMNVAIVLLFTACYLLFLKK